MEPDKDNIATFVHVVRQRSLSGAARHLGMPKSTVSRRLARLEQRLGTKLLHRDARRVTLTPEGTRFYDAVVEAVDALEQAVEGVEDSRTLPRGSVRLTAPGDFGRMVLAPHLVTFLRRYPEITLDLKFTNRFVDLVQEGVDVALRAGAVEAPNLIARKLAPSELQLAAAPGACSVQDDIEQLEQEPFVLFRAQGTQQLIRLETRAGERARSVELSVSGRVNVDDYSSMLELVAAGQGVGLMPSLHVQEGERAGRVERIFPEWALRSGQLHLVYSTRQLPERVRVLIEFLTEVLRT